MSSDAQHKTDPFDFTQADILASALRWQVEHGADAAVGDAPVNRMETANTSPLSALPKDDPVISTAPAPMPHAAEPLPPTTQVTTQRGRPPSAAMMGSAAARVAAEKAALSANTLDELRAAIAAFDGLSIRDTAMNCVFSDGHPEASVMLIGEAPGADEDKMGKPFVGASGQLLDKLLGYIGLSRGSEDAKSAVYISNIVNWRPPGNRTPTPQEMDISLPFIERHIALVKPKILLLVGNVPTKTLLQSKDGIMKLRGSWQPYQPTHADNQALLGNQPILTLPTFHPAFLLRSPHNKKTVWFDFITLQQKREELGLTK